MNNLIEILTREHDVIESVVNYSLKLSESNYNEPDKYFDKVKKILAFFIEYADKYHHQKEEFLLFPKMCEKNDLLKEGIIKEMIENHEDFRKSIKDIDHELSRNDWLATNRAINKYCSDLLNHISVENDELFQMIDMILSESEIEKIYYNCLDKDIEISLSRKEELESFAKSLTN